MEDSEKLLMSSSFASFLFTNFTNDLDEGVKVYSSDSKNSLYL